MPGLFEAFQRGFNMADAQRRQKEEEAYLRDERKYVRERRETVDPKQDRLMDAQVSGAEFETEMQPVRAESARLGLEGQREGVVAAKFENSRRPRRAAQEDESHAVNIAGAKQGQRLAANQDARASAAEGRAAAAFDIQHEMARIGLDAAKVEKQRKDYERIWWSNKQRVYQEAARGNFKGAEQIIEALYSAVDDGNPNNGLKVTDRGEWYVADEQGAPVQVVGDTEAALEFIDQYVGTPEIFAQSFVQNRAIAAQRAQFEAEQDALNNRAIIGAVGRAMQPSGFGSAPDPSKVQPMIDTLRGLGGRGATAPDQPGGMPAGARQGHDGNWYVPDPQRPGKYLRVEP